MTAFIKISQLPSTTGISLDDYLLVVDDPSGINITKKITVNTLIDTLLIDIIDGGPASGIST